MGSYAKEVIYSDDHWLILEAKRLKGLNIIRTLGGCGYASAILHGSIARGDITRNSDIDVALLYPYPVSMVKLCLEDKGYKAYDIRIVQPTPRHTPKVYIYLDPFEEQTVSIPLAELEPLEIEYYKFSGFITEEEILIKRRVKGVNKKLMLIIPTEKGHFEIPAVGNEGYVSRTLGVSIDVVRDRIEALMRRVEEGRTGLFVSLPVPIFEEVETYIKKLCQENVAFRRAVTKYGLCI